MADYFFQVRSPFVTGSEWTSIDCGHNLQKMLDSITYFRANQDVRILCVDSGGTTVVCEHKMSAKSGLDVNRRNRSITSTREVSKVLNGTQFRMTIATPNVHVKKDAEWLLDVALNALTIEYSRIFCGLLFENCDTREVILVPSHNFCTSEDFPRIFRDLADAYRSEKMPAKKRTIRKNLLQLCGYFRRKRGK